MEYDSNPRVAFIERLFLMVAWVAFGCSIGLVVWNLIEQPIDVFSPKVVGLIPDENGEYQTDPTFRLEDHWVKYYRERQIREIILWLFLFSSKTLLLTNVWNTRIRDWLFFIVIILSFIWTWLRLSTWGPGPCFSPVGQVIGGPLTYVMVPIAFFVMDQIMNPRPRISLLMVRLPVELMLLLPWAFVWGIIELSLGWIWI